MNDSNDNKPSTAGEATSAMDFVLADFVAHPGTTVQESSVRLPFHLSTIREASAQLLRHKLLTRLRGQGSGACWYYYPADDHQTRAGVLKESSENDGRAAQEVAAKLQKASIELQDKAKALEEKGLYRRAAGVYLQLMAMPVGDREREKYAQQRTACNRMSRARTECRAEGL